MRATGGRSSWTLGLVALAAVALAALYGGGGHAAHDLAEARLLDAVVRTVERDYVDPERINPRKMLKSALESVERAVPEVLVDFGAKEAGERLTVTVGTRRSTFTATEVTDKAATLDQLPGVMRDIFAYLQRWVRDEVDLDDVEYAAINGLLSTLDPHSVYLNREHYKEMKINTSGNFGGLGIVITVREGSLTIISPLEGTPASRAGLKARDKIVAIGDESTINMPLTEAVQRLRGEAGTPVTISVLRKGWNEPREFTLVRAVIQIESVKSMMLAGGVGLVKITNFQGNTTRDLKEALARFKASNNGKLTGLVLDLRNNPGGLLRQAISVSDLFLDSGVIVSRVGPGGRPAGRSEAKRGQTEPRYPIVVLVNGGSASASEIVAGALKNHGRSMVMGERTFGKGTVQVLYDARRQLFVDDESALKMTVEKYLTPGGISIQRVGIMPDVMLVAEYVDDRGVDLEPDERRRREENLDEAFEERTREAEKATIQIRHLAPPEDEDADFPISERTKALEVDFAIESARRLIAGVRGWRRSDLIAQAPRIWKPVIAEQRKKREQALAAVGVDWSGGTRRGKARLDATVAIGRSVEQGAADSKKKKNPSVSTCRIDPKGAAGKVVAGDEACLTVTVHNKGPAAVHRLHGFSECDECRGSPFDSVEFVLGKVEPGKSRTWSVPIKMPKDQPTQEHEFRVRFEEFADRVPAPLEARVQVEALPLPAFAYSYRLVDEAPGGNGDGLAQVGETVTLRLSIGNQGAGPSLETLAMVEDKAGSDLFLRKGRVTLKEPLAVGQTTSVDFTFEVRGRAETSGRPLELMIRDTVLREYVVERLSFGIYEPTRATVRARDGWLTVQGDSPLLAGAADDAQEVARVLKGSTLKLVGEIGRFYKVAVGSGGETAFLAAASARPASAPGKGESVPSLVRSQKRRPPEILIEGADQPLVVDGDTYLLKGLARDDTELKDVYIFAGSRKVFFAALDPARGGPPELPFEVVVTLKDGDNVIVVVAREGEEFSSRRSVVVRRPVQHKEAKVRR